MKWGGAWREDGGGKGAGNGNLEGEGWEEGAKKALGMGNSDPLSPPPPDPLCLSSRLFPLALIPPPPHLVAFSSSPSFRYSQSQR